MKKIRKAYLLILAIAITITSFMLPSVAFAGDISYDIVSDVVFVIDDTKSMKTNDKSKLTAVAVSKYIDNYLPKESGRAGGVGIVTFANKVLNKRAVTYVDSKKKGNEIKKAVYKSIKQNGNCTNCAKGIREAVSMLSTSKNASKAIILVTDGEYDFDGSESSKKQQLKVANELLKEQVKKAKDKGIRIYTIKINGTGKTSYVGKVNFKYITKTTGALHFGVKNADNVDTAIRKISDSLWGTRSDKPTSIPISKGNFNKTIKFPQGVVYANIQIDHKEPLSIKSFVYKNNSADVSCDITNENTYLNIRVSAPEAGEAVLAINSKKSQTIVFSCVLSQEMTAKAKINESGSATINTRESAKITVCVYEGDKNGKDFQDSISLSAIVKDSAGKLVGDAHTMSLLQDNEYTVELEGKELTPDKYTVEVEIYNQTGEAIVTTAPMQLVVEEAPFNVFGLVLGIIAAILLIAAVVVLLMIIYKNTKPRLMGTLRYDYRSPSDERFFQTERLDGKGNKNAVLTTGELVKVSNVPELNEVVFSAAGKGKKSIIQIDNKNAGNQINVTTGQELADMVILPSGEKRTINIGDRIEIDIPEKSINIVINREE